MYRMALKSVNQLAKFIKEMRCKFITYEFTNIISAGNWSKLIWWKKNTCS